MTRIAIIIKERCFPQKCGGYLCAKLCPVNRTGKDCITAGEDKKAKIDEKLCTGCGICPKRCPFGAIKIINLPEKLTKSPIHRYGDNAFELFSLPIPVFGKVTGIIGQNGVGKSTALKIVANVLKPNLGRYKDSTVPFEEVLSYFSGTEMQLFLNLVQQNKLKISYKPQQIELIPKLHKGKVEDLLKKVDEKKKLKEIINILDLKEILDHNLLDISGGELQRVAIAATVLKDAQLYIFDEPTSYLDIKQRLKVCTFIQSLATPNIMVLVVEHDLIVLDYIADFVQVMYGEESAYGIVSGLKSAKEGINIFLSGYLREENVRFRSAQIKFERTPAVEASRRVPLCKWGDIKAKLGRFSLNADGGEIYKGEVVGVLGENGIGKTTFVKILAGVLEPDSGEFSKIKVSYKPQYLTPTEDIVITVLRDAAKYKGLFEPLGLEILYTKKLNQLSGGELQRVAVARALSQGADLYLLDEPSAYLDVEQRLSLSKILKKFAQDTGATILVVDHDLLFLDYLSNRLMVFEGKPAVSGIAKGPFDMQTGMNMFLKDLGITFRRDEQSGRPRANKVGSVMDREQKSENRFYYT